MKGKKLKNKNKNKSNSSFFKLVLDYYKKYKVFFILMLVFVLLASISRIIQPKILNQLLETIYFDNSNIEWWGWASIMLGFLVLVAIFTFISNWIGGKLGKRIEVETRKKAISNLMNQDMSYFSSNKSGETLTKVISDTSIIGDQSQRVPSQVLSAIFMVFGGAIVLFTIDWKLTLVTIGVTFAIMAIIIFSFSTVRKRMLFTRSVVTKVNGEVSDKIGAIGLIKASGTEALENKHFNLIHEDYYQSNNKVNISLSLVMTAFTAGVMSISVIVIITSVFLYHNDPVELLVLPSFLSGVGLMVSPIVQMAQLSQGLAQATASAERLDELLNKETRINLLDQKDKVEIKNLDGDIVFRNVEFAYPEKPNEIILPKMSFTFEKGKSYAFVGETGVGKSTISKLLLRFYDPTSGDVFINNDINLKDVFMPSYLRKVGYVEQDPQIIYGTIKDNIAYGMEDVSDKEIVEVCKKAKLHSIIETWDKKYDTILGERGITLSGGQKQRMIIARMFLKNPDLIILDEATSALDNIVESEINEQLSELSKGKTSITIAHRLSTIKNVDKIIVLKKGKGIVEVGSFKELKDKDGYFKDLYEAGMME